MNILVIGGCGYVGSAIFRRLEQAGHEVASIDVERRGNPGIKNNTVINHAHVSRFDQFDAVIFMAGVSSVGEARANPYGAFMGNLVQLGRLTQRLNGQPLIYASSAAVHAPPGPATSNMYDVTKTAADAIIPLLYSETWSLRFGTVAGPSPNMRFDTVVNAMVRSARSKDRIYVSNAGAWRPVLGMEDLLNGIEGILEGVVPPGLHDLCSLNAKIDGIATAVAAHYDCKIVQGPDSPTYDFMMRPSPWFVPHESLTSIIESLDRHYLVEGIV